MNGKLIFSHGESNSCGVTILTGNDLELKINLQILDNEGRFILLDCCVKEIRYILVNIYAPTIDKPSDQANFGAYIWDNLKPYLGCNIVIGGDFNKNIESLQSITTNPHDQSYSNYLYKLCDTIDRVDIWKLHNPESVRYTQFEKKKKIWTRSITN